MTLTEIKEKILTKYKIGQVVNLRYRNDKGKITERRKAEIIKFYPCHVLCKVDDCHECFTYVELGILTQYKKGDK